MCDRAASCNPTDVAARVRTFKPQDACVASLFTAANLCNSRGKPMTTDDSVQTICECECTCESYAGASE